MEQTRRRPADLVVEWETQAAKYRRQGDYTEAHLMSLVRVGVAVGAVQREASADAD